MTIQTTTTEVTSTANGVQTNFPFTYAVQLDTDIEVYVDDVEQTTGITVNLNADQDNNPGGSVDFSVAPTDQSEVVVKRVVSLTQTLDYDVYDDFPTESSEDALDKLTMIAQQQETTLGTKLEWVDVPASASATGTAGQLAYESGFLYICVATDTWQRVVIATWS